MAFLNDSHPPTQRQTRPPRLAAFVALQLPRAQAQDGQPHRAQIHGALEVQRPGGRTKNRRFAATTGCQKTTELKNGLHPKSLSWEKTTN